MYILIHKTYTLKMGISYDIIFTMSNQGVESFGLKWLQEYSNFNLPNLDMIEMIEYCQVEIDKLEYELNSFDQITTFENIKNKLIHKIQISKDKIELQDLINQVMDEDMILDPSEDKINHITWMIENFKRLLDFIGKYLWSENSNHYRGELSY